MRERLRAIVTVVRICVRADPWRNLVSLIAGVLRHLVPLAVASSLATLAQGVATRDLDRAVQAAVVLGLVYVISEVSWVFTFRVDMRTRETGGHALDEHLLDLMSSIPGIEHFERAEHADKILLLQRARWQLAGIVPALVNNIGLLVQLISTGLVLARVSPWLLLLVVAGLPSLWASSRSTKLQEKVSEELAEPSRVQSDLLQTAVTAEAAGEVRLFGLDRELRRRHESLWRTLHRRRTRLALQTQLVELVAWLLFAAAFVGSLALLADRAVRGTATVGDVVLTLTLGNQVRDQLARAARLMGWLITCAKSADRYIWISGQATDSAARLTPTDPQAAPARLDRGIELRGVRFCYPGTDEDVLRDVDLVLPAGATVAIVGDNGAGKSTLVKLLARFYEPTEGEILVDGVPLTSIPAEEWRLRTSAGFQDYMKPELSAQEAVGVGLLEDIESAPAVTAALERGSGADVLEALPAGLGTQVGRTFPGGVELSGGQWQKLALGRGMMRPRPLLLLLDEPTSALDARAEHDLFERFTGAAHRAATESGGITVLVSHRFSTVRMADLILVIDGGRIAEHGSHAELVALGGLYAELFELQARAYR